MIKDEILGKISDEKIKRMVDRFIGNQQDYMSYIFDDPIYKEYREKYDKQYEINKRFTRKNLNSIILAADLIHF
jgi:hypothetical protein